MAQMEASATKLMDFAREPKAKHMTRFQGNLHSTYAKDYEDILKSSKTTLIQNSPFVI